MIVEVLGAGKAYLVELFGAWVEMDAHGTVKRSDEESPTAFMVETIGVATVLTAHQLT